MKLIWIVGARGSFGPQGHYPSATTSRRVERTVALVPPWVRCACTLVEAAGLVHDIGKASQRFQAKLREFSSKSDDIRHEWISLKLLQRLRSNGKEWAQAWTALRTRVDALSLGARVVDSRSTLGVSDYLEAIDLLVCTHHGLLASDGTIPTSKRRHVRRDPEESQLQPAGCVGDDILRRYWELEAKLKSQGLSHDTVAWRGLLMYARPALILADHAVSSQVHPLTRHEDGLFANTVHNGDATRLNQPLDVHLRSVAAKARDLMWRLWRLTDVEPDQRYESLPALSDDSVESILRPADSDGRFAWQNRCADELARARRVRPLQPALVFNMASTGSGKTRMNARIACVLAGDRPVRISVALNLRSLTLQTGDALKSALNLGADEIAVVVGDAATQKLFENQKAADAAFLRDPANTDENISDEDFFCFGDDRVLPGWIEELLKVPRERVLVGAPLLVSTVDFLVSAGDPDRQGKHAKALIRLMTSDLVLDEIDGYEPKSLVAVLRLIQISALFGRNVICSSATLSAPVAEAVERAFRSGLQMRARIEGIVPAVQQPDGGEAPQELPNQGDSYHYTLAFVDDQLAPRVEEIRQDSASFSDVYAARLKEITTQLAGRPAYRKARLYTVNPPEPEAWMSTVERAVLDLHDAHAWPCGNSQRISFGLVRVANIPVAIEVARSLADNIPYAQVACYHANDFMIARFHKERQLDKLLRRAGGDRHISADQEISQRLSSVAAESVPFVVVATPVEEIGRDHDFDWAVIDVSSAQSIVQTAGRVNRHRLTPLAEKVNVAIPSYNYRHCKNVAQGRLKEPAFIWPGYESTGFAKSYAEHDLRRLLPWNEDMLVVDAGLRFDTARCVLTRADDEAIRGGDLKKFFGEKGGYFTRCPVDAWLLSTGPYHESALRVQQGVKLQLRLVREAEEFLFQRRERVESRWGKLVFRWMEHTVPAIPARSNAWLNLTYAEMAELCQELGVSLEDGLSAELTQYGETEDFHYDEGFGFYRVV